MEFEVHLADVEKLNRLALAGRADVIKVSFHAWLTLRERYTLLESGSALGYGNGPLLISRKQIPVNKIPDLRIALPGEHTTAHLLFNIAFPAAKNKEFMIFSDIEDAILSGRADAGVIIHENRFTFQQKGLTGILDLGSYWEKLTGVPIPLGGIVVKNELGDEIIAGLNRIMHRSVKHALENPEEAMEFVRKHAQEMNEEVMRKHISLYVNRFTLELGNEGKSAINRLIEEMGKD
jgi:1,4-dihydroxy-6-naphthoate synthase